MHRTMRLQFYSKNASNIFGIGKISSCTTILFYSELQFTLLCGLRLYCLIYKNWCWMYIVQRMREKKRHEFPYARIMCGWFTLIATDFCFILMTFFYKVSIYVRSLMYISDVNGPMVHTFNLKKFEFRLAIPYSPKKTETKINRKIIQLKFVR